MNMSPTSHPIDTMNRTKSTDDFRVHTDHKAHDRSFRNKSSKRIDSSSSDNTLVDVPDPDVMKNTRDYANTRLPGLPYEWPDVHTAEKPPLLSSPATILTPPKSLSPEMIMPCVPRWDGLKCSTNSNNPFNGLMEADLQRCGQGSLIKNENKINQENTFDRTMESLEDLFAAWSLPWTPPVEQPRPSRVQQGIKDSVTHTHTHKPTVEAKMMRRCTVSFVDPPSKPLVESQKEQASNKQMVPALSLYWHDARAGSGPPHRLPVDAKTLTITTMAQFELLKKAVISSDVVGLSIKEDGTTSAKPTRLQPHFNFCVLQVVCSSEPRTVFKLEMHRLEHDASSRKDIFTAYDSTTTKYIIPGSNTARSLSAHLIVLLQELLKNPSIVKVCKFLVFQLLICLATLIASLPISLASMSHSSPPLFALINTSSTQHITGDFSCHLPTRPSPPPSDRRLTTRTWSI